MIIAHMIHVGPAIDIIVTIGYQLYVICYCWFKNPLSGASRQTLESTVLHYTVCAVSHRKDVKKLAVLSVAS